MRGLGVAWRVGGERRWVVTTLVSIRCWNWDGLHVSSLSSAAQMRKQRLRLVKHLVLAVPGEEEVLRIRAHALAVAPTIFSSFRVRAPGRQWRVFHFAQVTYVLVSSCVTK